MKKSIYLLFAFVCSFFLTSGQSSHFLKSYGFNTNLYALSALHNNRWVIAASSSVDPGIPINTVLKAIIFDSGADIQQEIDIALPQNQGFYVTDLLGLPDGGFAILVGFNNCISYFSDRYLAVYDSSGLLKWDQQFVRNSDKLKVSPEGHLLCLHQGPNLWSELKAYDINNGNLVWSKMLNSGNTTSYFKDYLFFDNDNIIFGIGSPDFQKWERTQSNMYTLVNSYNFSNSSQIPEKLLLDSFSNRVVTYHRNGRLYEIDPNSFSYNSTGWFSSIGIKDLVTKDSNLIVFGSNSIACANYNADITETLLVFPDRLVGKKLSLQNQYLVLAGTYLSGGNASTNSSSVLWVLIYDLSQKWKFELPYHDVEFTSVSEISPVSIDTISLPNNSFEYALTGGRYKFGIKNMGLSVLHSIDICSRYQFVQNPICNDSYRPSFVSHFTDLQISPGEIGYIEMDQPLVEHQLLHPNALCFWASAPNALPDLVLNNDTRCFFLDPVSSTEEYNLPLNISPTLVVDQLKIASGENAKFIRVSAISGITILEQTQYQDFIDVGSLPQGYYVVSALIENRWHTGKFVKQ